MVNILVAGLLMVAAEFLMNFVLMLVILNVSQLAGIVYAGCMIVKFVCNSIIRIQAEKIKGEINGNKQR